MALLDFIKNRQTQPPAPKTQPETAKAMYAREASQEKASQPSPASLSPDQQAKVKEVQATMQKASHSLGQTSPSASPTEGTANPQPMVQRATNQDKAAPALSPTSAQAGVRSHEQEKPSPSPAKTPGKTMPRPPPSWER